MNSDIERILISKEQLAKKVEEIADQINKDYNGEEILLVCILRGASVFAADLLRCLNGKVKIDFMSVSSYDGTSSSGEVKITKDLVRPIEDENVIIVEDIIDSGLTLSYLKKMLLNRNPKSLKLCTILDKPSRRTVDLKGDYVGFEIPNEFVVGYGLDYNGLYRNLPEVCILSPKVYNA